MSGIGILNEKPLHASLKEWYSQPGDQFEVKVNGFEIDIVRDDMLIEIQTGNFSSIKSKLQKLVPFYRLTLVYPIALEKWIVKSSMDSDTDVTRRKSPKKGRIEDLYGEIVSIPYLLTNPNFSLDVLLIHEEELRYYDGKRNWRRRGWVTQEHRLLEVIGRKRIEAARDLLSFIPADLGETFTTKELAETMGICRNLAQKMAYCLRKMDLIELVGKRERSNLYEMVDTKDL